MLDESGYTGMWHGRQIARGAGPAGEPQRTGSRHGRFRNAAAASSTTSRWSWKTSENATTPRSAMMTLHGAKGLEFDTVFLPGWEEGVFPNQRALDEGGVKPAWRRSAASPMSASPGRAGAPSSATPPTAASMRPGRAASPAASSRSCRRSIVYRQRTWPRSGSAAISRQRRSAGGPAGTTSWRREGPVRRPVPKGIAHRRPRVTDVWEPAGPAGDPRGRRLCRSAGASSTRNSATAP